MPDLCQLRTELGRLATALANAPPLPELYRGRALELALETSMVEAIGTNAFAPLSARRFAPPDADSATRARHTAEQWADLEGGTSGLLVPSDDPAEPRSLYCRLQREIGRLRLPFRVDVCNMSAAAATGEGVILVARGRKLSVRATERIVAHEVFGHALPRYRAARERQPLFALGSARGNDEQEGYALYLELEGGHLDDARKRELGMRHLAAEAVHDGADWVETTRLLLARGAEPAEAVSIASRAHRAGGLGRERVYLPALHRVRRAASEDPSVLDWLGRGRLDLTAIRVLRGIEGEPRSLAKSS